uniref:Uncharacterized protein n=1 Tax=Cacopsylla melanoneura TaxID=428564 RepID=A0A8D9BCD6_9HEMI
MIVMTGTKRVLDMPDKCEDDQQSGNKSRQRSEPYCERENRSCMKEYSCENKSGTGDQSISLGGEIEIDLNVQDSQTFLRQLAALCNGYNKQVRGVVAQPTVVDNRRNDEYQVNVCSEASSSELACFEQYHSPTDCTCTKISSDCSDDKQVVDVKKSQKCYKRQEKRFKRERKCLQKNCENKGKKIIKEYKLKERIRLKEDRMNYKILKRDLERELKDRKCCMKERLKREKTRINQKKIEEQHKLLLLKDKIQKKCKAIKYMVNSNDSICFSKNCQRKC